LSTNETNNIKKGRLLLAEPYLLDPNFRRGVILLCDHQKDGSFGFILNKPIEMGINELISTFPDFDSEVHFGGPVQTDTIHYLHTKGELLEDSVEVIDGVYWGGDFEQLKGAIKAGQIQPDEIRFFVGYAGWSEGQLEAEKKYLSWMTADGHIDYIFASNAKALWQEVLQDKGGTYSIIGQMKPPNLN